MISALGHNYGNDYKCLNCGDQLSSEIEYKLVAAINSDAFMSKVKYFPFGKSDRLDNRGRITNIIPLPKKIEDILVNPDIYGDIEISWTANESELLDNEYKLLKQYLRYHEVVLTYTVVIDGQTLTNEIVINVGVAEKANTVYVGGNFYQQKAKGNVAADVLCQLSKFDSPVGNVGGSGKVWGYAYSRGEFNGYTWYIDVIDENLNEVIRYQYFACTTGFVTLDDKYEIKLTNPSDPTSAQITLNDSLNPYVDNLCGSNWVTIYYNVSDKDVKIPLNPKVDGDSPFADTDGNKINWNNHPWKATNVIDRENAFGVDGFRTVFVADSKGNIVAGNGAKSFQANYDVNNDSKLTEDDYWITIPAGGLVYAPRTQQNKPEITGVFCNVGTKITMSFFEPFHISVDGSSEGLHSFRHE